MITVTIQTLRGIYKHINVTTNIRTFSAKAVPSTFKLKKSLCSSWGSTTSRHERTNWKWEGGRKITERAVVRRVPVGSEISLSCRTNTRPHFTHTRSGCKFLSELTATADDCAQLLHWLLGVIKQDGFDTWINKTRWNVEFYIKSESTLWVGSPLSASAVLSTDCRRPHVNKCFVTFN